MSRKVVARPPATMPRNSRPGAQSRDRQELPGKDIVDNGGVGLHAGEAGVERRGPDVLQARSRGADKGDPAAQGTGFELPFEHVRGGDVLEGPHAASVVDEQTAHGRPWG